MRGARVPRMIPNMKLGPRFDSVDSPLGAREILGQLDSADAWLRRLGAEPKGRMIKYRKEIQKILDHPSGDLTADTINAIFEADELATIAKLPVELLCNDRNIARVKSLAKGDEFYTSMADDKGRRFAFELAMASFTASCGMKTTLETPADVNATMRQWNLQIECKRPDSSKSVERNISDAFDWFRNRPGSPDILCFASIDLTKALHATYGYAEGRTLEDAREVTKAHGIEIVSSYNRVISNLCRDNPQMSGIFYRMRMIARSSEPFPAVRTTSDWSIGGFRNSDAWITELSNRLAARARR